MVGVHSVAVLASTAVETGRNLVTNPSLETALTGWTASRGTVSRAAIPHPVAGAWGGQFVSTVGTVGQGNYTALPLMPTTPGTHSAAIYLEPFGAAIGLRFRLWITWNDAGGAQVGQYFAPAVVVGGGAMVRLVATTSNAPATTTQARLFVQAMEPVPVDAGWYWDAAQLLRADEPGAYWDGDTTDTPVTAYAWAGTAHASQSVRSSYLAADLSCLVDEVSINHGRDDSGSQPEASSATITLTADPAAPLPPTVDVGSTVAVSTTTMDGESTRFVGRVTDIALGWDEAGADTPDAGVGQIVAVGMLADFGRRVVGDAPWPQELDGARVARVMAATGYTLNPATSDPGTVLLLPRDVDSQPALDVAQAAATSATGVLWETRSGDVRYADADHRRGTASTVTLDACDLLVTPTWRRSLEGLVNEVSIGYGLVPAARNPRRPKATAAGEQPRYVATDAASVSKWGRYGYTASTELATLADAQEIGTLLLARNSQPVWVMAALPVDVSGLDQARYQALLSLDMHGLLTLTGLPSLGTAPTSAVLWVEGWKETLAYGTHELELVVSGYCRTAPPPRWDDVDPSWTWDALDPALTWDGAACLGPPANQGRWNDQAATLRWDQLAPAITWDTYPNY